MNEKLTTKGSDFAARLERAKDLAEIFEIVKEAVRSQLGLSRAGLMLGLAELGGRPEGWIGGFYPVATNIIVMNKGPMNRILADHPHLYKPYCFHILLHEYVHAVGYMDEELTRRRTLEISAALFGQDHAVTMMAADISHILPHLTYAVPQEPSEEMDLELVKGFDRSCTTYIN